MLQKYNELEGPDEMTIRHKRDRELNHKEMSQPDCQNAKGIYFNHVKKVKADASESSNEHRSL